MNKLDMVVIHDLKNTLMNIALKLDKYDELKQDVKAIMASSGKLNNLLLLNKYDSDEFSFQLDAQAPADMINSVAENFRNMFPDVEIECNWSESPVIWFYDQYYLELAINSALHNAAHYAKNKVNLSAYKENGLLVFEVRDDGEGFNENVIKKFNNKEPISATERGTGLGLILAEAIASRHVKKMSQGRVEIYNDNGAVFKIILP